MIDPEILDESDYGMRMVLSGNTKEYYEAIKGLQLSLIQNEQMSMTDLSEMLLASIGGTSPYETNELLHKIQEKKEAREQQMQQQQTQLEQTKVSYSRKTVWSTKRDDRIRTQT